MMSFIIRNGEINDVKSILDLIKELATFEKQPNEVEVTEDDLIRDGFSENPKFETFVAEEPDGSIVGIALFYERYSTWKGKIIHLEDLIVKHSKRGKNIGKTLYTSVLNYAYEKGCKRVSWEVLDWNSNAIKFYESSGATILEDWKVVQMDEKSIGEFVKKTKQ